MIKLYAKVSEEIKNIVGPEILEQAIEPHPF